MRLGKNIGGYFGEPLDLPRFLRELDEAARNGGWSKELFLNTDALQLWALHKRSNNPRRRLYISTGLHGDEPAGPLAVLQLMQQGHWPVDVDVSICPCLNPTGFSLNRRENLEGIDLNREYHDPTASEVKAHINWLNRQLSFDVCLCLHEDWEAHGFYVYELNPDNQASFAEAIVRRVAEVCPIDISDVIEGRPAVGGIIRPSPDPLSRPQWPEGFYLLRHKTRRCYTLEAPSDYPVRTRVAALVAAVRAVLGELELSEKTSGAAGSNRKQ
jgi:protein MpaA